MTDEQEKLIRDYWKRWRGAAQAHLHRSGDVFRAPIYPPLTPLVEPFNAPVEPQTIEVLEYRLEHGGRDGRPIARVVCDGVEVESWERR